MSDLRRWMGVVFVGAAVGAGAQAPVEKVGGAIDLPSSKQITGVVPGGPQRVNSLPVSLAASPDGRWVVSVNGGYGSYESRYMQSVAVLETATGKVTDYPDARMGLSAKQTLFSGLSFSRDGKKLYGTVVSTSDPAGKKEGNTGTGVQVYSFVEGRVTPERLIRIPMQTLAAGRKTKLGDGTLGVPYPAAIAVVGSGGQFRGGPTHRDEAAMNGRQGGGPQRVGERLLVADNLSDDVLLIDVATGTVLTRFDVSENDVVPSTYPIAVSVSKDGRRGFVALWNASEVVELDLEKGLVGRKLPLLKPEVATAASSHPTSVAMAPDGRTLYVALGNRDAVAAVDLAEGGFKLKGYFDVRLPGQSYYGAQPESVAVSADGGRVYVADMGADAVAVLDARRLTKGAAQKGLVEPIGFVPTEWLPLGTVVSGGKLYVASGKGTGTGPNNFAQRETPATKGNKAFLRSFTYIPTLLHGSLAVIEEGAIERGMKAMTAETLEDNRMKAAAETIAWAPGAGAGARTAKVYGDACPVGGPVPAAGSAAGLAAGATPGKVECGKAGATFLLAQGDSAGASGAGGGRSASPIKHVIYIIKENRTYDQLFGDLTWQGKAVGNGDPSLTMYGAEITPNQHKLALQFGVLDNFYDSAEVSGDGHVWSNAGIGSDALERTWQINYRGREHTYDFEGVVAAGLPLEQKIPDVVEPASGYLWGNLAKHGMTLYHFGEYISSTFCTDKGAAAARQDDPREGPMREGRACTPRTEVKPGEKLPEVWGGGVNQWPWAIPLLAENHATKPELVGHFAPETPDFNLRIPDQIRVGIFLRHLDGWIADRKTGTDTMPNFVMLRLANDHTAGTTAGGPTPKSSIADNDLAIGRAVDAISHSAFWDDTAFFILEDDAQNGADHVDAHRSDALVISKYAPRTADGAPFVDSRFYSTVSIIRTMESVLGLPPMNNNDAFSSMMGSLFTGAGDQPAFTADYANRDNGLIFMANPKTAPGAKASSRMDFRHADRADARKLNVILWQDAMGAKAVPAMLTEKRKKAKKDDDDD